MQPIDLQNIVTEYLNIDNEVKTLKKQQDLLKEKLKYEMANNGQSKILLPSGHGVSMTSKTEYKIASKKMETLTNRLLQENKTGLLQIEYKPDINLIKAMVDAGRLTADYAKDIVLYTQNTLKVV